jgi:hypothetical protein
MIGCGFFSKLYGLNENYGRYCVLVNWVDLLVIILGLNAFHAVSFAALLRDGRLIAAAEEERFRRIKHWAGFSSQPANPSLWEAGVTV